MKNDIEMKMLLSQIRLQDMLPRPIRDRLEEDSSNVETEFYTITLKDGKRYSVECFMDQKTEETLVYDIINLPN